MRVAVAGAGVLGAAVAFRLVQAGVEVVLVDRGQPGSGTSSTTFAWLNSNEKHPKAYYDLNLAGMREHARLAEELDDAPWLRSGGNVEWRAESDLLADKVDRLRSWGYAAEWWPVDELRTHLEPSLQLPDEVHRVAFFPEEGWIDAALFARRLTELAVQRGATARTGSELSGVVLDDHRISGITLDDGEQIPVDALVNAAGADADSVAGLVGLSLPLAPTSGVLVLLSADTTVLGRVVHAPDVNLRPDGPGRVLIHHDSIDERLHAGACVDDLAGALVGRGRAVLPELAEATVEHVRIGVRPMPRDGFPCVGAVGARQGYYEAITHSGATLAPVLGRLLAREIRTGAVDPLVAAYSPDRFSRA